MSDKKPMLKTDMYLDQGKPWSLATLSQMTGKTKPQLKKLMTAGLPYEVNGNAYLFDSKVAIKWIIDHEISNALPAVEDGGYISINQAKRRFEVAKMLQAELALAKEREEVANIDDLMTNFTGALVQVRAKLVSMPSRLAGILSHQEEYFIAETLETEIIETLESLSDYNHEYIGNVSESEDQDNEGNNGSNSPVPFPTPKT